MNLDDLQDNKDMIIFYIMENIIDLFHNYI